MFAKCHKRVQFLQICPENGLFFGFFFNWETNYHYLSTTPVLPAAAFISAYEVSWSPLLKYWLHITAQN